MVDERADITIPQEIKEDYEYVKDTISASKSIIPLIPTGFFNVENNEDSNDLINWSEVLPRLNEHIKQSSPESSSLTAEYIDWLMYAACLYNDYDLSIWLIKNGANVNFQEPESGNTLLHLAALNGNVELAELLMTNGAHLNYYYYDIKANLQGNTCLHFAAERGYNGFIQFIEREAALKSMGMDNIYDLIAYKNKEGNTALHLAAKNGHVGFVKKLLSNSFYLSSENYYLDKFILCCVATVIQSYGLSIFLTKVAIQIIESRDYNSLYYLYFCCGICIATSLGLSIYFLISGIIEDKYSPVIVNNDGKTASHLAIKNLQKENGEDRYYQCARLLIEHIPHSKINIQDKEGRTILHLAAEKGFIKSIELLLNKKADAMVITNNKKTALHLAIENSHYNCAMCLAQGIQTKQERLRLKLLEFYYIIRNKYDYHIQPYITDFKEKMQKKIQVKKSWQEEVLCLAIKHQSKGSSDNEKWLFKREVVGQLLKMIDASEIDDVYSYAKDYSERKDIEDGNYVLKKLNNFFCAHDKYKSKNLSKLKTQESWCKDHILHTTSVLSAILALLFILNKNSDLSNNYYFSEFDNALTIVVKGTTILSVYFTIKLYLKHQELDKLTDYQDKVDEINNLLIKKKEVNTNSHIKVQDSNLYKPNHSNRCQNSDQLVLHSDTEEACSSQQQKKSLYTFSKSELDKLKHLSTKQSSVLDIESTSELKVHKTLDKRLIKNPSFNEFIASTRF
ncbi:ankyrin repeat domain-containing protein [Candidatus Mesenet endosymbiont of Agriotes lineatus]|uniref:ankyrin repeat domain-containing protein n=1 Tax=Candidatus Mesenet endosymbiont of Agriotes lineatus TaxID=3077948 RepID=UPI0030D047D2